VEANDREAISPYLQWGGPIRGRMDHAQNGVGPQFNDFCAICSVRTKAITNEARTHLSLHEDAPIPRAVQTVGRTLAMPVLGGLHHQYSRV
jgi:hypothetical protein